MWEILSRIRYRWFPPRWYRESYVILGLCEFCYQGLFVVVHVSDLRGHLVICRQCDRQYWVWAAGPQIRDWACQLEVDRWRVLHGKKPGLAEFGSMGPPQSDVEFRRMMLAADIREEARRRILNVGAKKDVPWGERSVDWE